MKKGVMIFGFIILAVGIISLFSSWHGITGMATSEASGLTPAKTISIMLIFFGAFLFLLSSHIPDKKNKKDDKDTLVKFEDDEDEEDNYLEDDEIQDGEYYHPVYTG